MTGICIPKLLAKLDGTFGCKVVVKKTNDGAHKISFEKKTVLDLIRDFFSSPEVMKKSRATAVTALRQIATQLGDLPDSRFSMLVARYESTDDAINFKEVRSALNISIAPRGIILPPVVYALDHADDFQVDQDDDFANEIERVLNYDGCREPDLQEVKVSIFEAPAPPQGLVRTSVPTYRNTREQFEEIYRYRLGESIHKKTYKIEMVRDPDGTVSDDNLAALAETTVEIERITKIPLFVSDDGIDDEEFRVLSGRLDSAFVSYLTNHRNPYAHGPEADVQKVKAEINELQAEYGRTFLRI